ncbi:DUF3089 domain-containing protein [Phenylobacterium immobile]|uniref:DUF3089 domain-containing protein n=1 Tax=Phenylobacterium immobile TaxID=21 RepID=UPI000A6D3F06|nr:DUF3089 domain-containing protein [Phenylobacterium immobile]
MRPPGWITAAAIGLVALVVGAAALFWGDVMQSTLDPRTPFQTYTPPPAPDYEEPQAWLLKPRSVERPQADLEADVFFIAPTTYDGGRDWNAPIGDPAADQLFRRVMAPNYAGAFTRVGRIFAPRYRQAGLYSQLTLREDARDARRFAYGDVATAFRWYVAHSGDRPFVLVGVEQGGFLGQRLLAEEITARPQVRSRLVAAYLIETAAPADRPAAVPCVRKDQAGCFAAWISARVNREDRARELLDRALVWTAKGEVENLRRRPALCFNPILGAVSDQPALARSHLGAANATGLEWDARPAFLKRQVAAQCRGGVLRVSQPKSPSLRPAGSWIERRRAPGFNLFYADLEADARGRVAAWRALARGAQSQPGLPVE